MKTTLCICSTMCLLLLRIPVNGQVNLEMCKISLHYDKGDNFGVGYPEGSLQEVIKQLHLRLASIEGLVKPKTCSDISRRNPTGISGVYTIYPFGEALEVFCDLTTDGGGWLVFQKRMDGSVNFTRGWEDYVNGFGSMNEEFWLGLENIHKITSSGSYEMRVDMEDFGGVKKYAVYSSFAVGPGIGYSLTIAKPPTGDAGDGMEPTGTKFTTFDKDQDSYSTNCAVEFGGGGGWFGACHYGNPNGIYHGGRQTSYADGVNWQPFRGYHYSLKTMEMKIRKTTA